MATSSAGATVYLIFIQVASRALTFVGNQILLRYLSPALLGIAVQLELVSVTVLYSARESLRVSLQRQPEASIDDSKNARKGVAQKRSQSVVNLSYLAIALGLFIALIFGASYFRGAKAEVLDSPDFTNAFLIYGLATVIELLAEPSFLIIQQHSLYAARARAETTAAIARCVSACVTAVGLSKTGHVASVLPFAVGQLNYACALFVFYFSAASKTARQEHFKLIPVTVNASNYALSFFNKATLALAATMYLQMVFKLLLTEGDAVILSVLSSLSDQGAFALAANYGGLLARLVFQPIEESSRNTFGRLLHTATPRADINSALSHLSSLVHFYLLASLPLVTLIPPLIPIVTPYLFSSAFRTPAIASLLATYIYYIPFMAVNGILDSFVTSVATPAQLRYQSLWMAAFTALYGTAAWVLLQKMRLGAQGLVLANIFNMIFRISWSGAFIGSWIEQQQQQQQQQKGSTMTRRGFWIDCMPHAGVFIAALGALSIPYTARFMEETQMKYAGIDLDKLAIFVAQVAFFAGSILLFERDFLILTLQSIIPQRLASKIPYLKQPHKPQKDRNKEL